MNKKDELIGALVHTGLQAVCDSYELRTDAEALLKPVVLAEVKRQIETEELRKAIAEAVTERLGELIAPCVTTVVGKVAKTLGKAGR